MKKRFQKWGAWLLSALPFLFMQIFIMVLGRKIHYFSQTIILPNILFAVLWIGFIILEAKFLGKRVGKFFYGLMFAIFYILFLTHGIYFELTEGYFGFHLLQMAKEGSGYVWNTIIHTSPLIYLVSLLVLITGIIAIWKFQAKEHRDMKKSVLLLAIFLLVHACIPFLYGSGNQTLQWNNFKNARNIYSSFYDKNKAMKACGFFEYTARDFYLTYLKPKEAEDPEEMAILEQAYSTETTHPNNDYSEKYKGKNVIFLQLEGIDSWLLTEDTMPQLYELMNQSMEFTNHFSYYNGGGSTFNSELAVNTGFITPVSYTRNAYTFVTNAFPYSLPNMLKAQGYQANAFHMNTGEFYSRRINYLNWGYDSYRSLLDEGTYKDKSYELDRELVDNEEFYKGIFQNEQPFMDYIITYTNHTPFDGTNEAVQMLLKEKYPDGAPSLTEEEYSRLMAGETDKMIGLLMQGLKDNQLYDNTVLVVYADHYLYTLSDKSILDKYKNTEDNRINQTPFFIWSSDMEHQQIDKVNAQIDILPTVLNLLGITYVEENYIGKDILDDSYSGYAFFSDGSLYDGKTYMENAELPLIQKNDLTLKYDAFVLKK